MSDITGILIHETSRIIVAGLHAEQIQGLDIELRIGSIYDALRRAATGTGVRDLPSFDRPSQTDDEVLAEIDRVLEREARSPKTNTKIA